MIEQDEQLRVNLMELMLEYIEGKSTVSEIIDICSKAYNASMPLVPALADVVFQLNSMGNKIAEGEDYSREAIQETFTVMLDKLTT